MAREPRHDSLAADLRALGRAVPTPSVPADLPAAVLARLEDARPSPARRPGARRRVLVVVVLALLASLAAPGVRAAVSDWFRFAGVDVRIEPRPGPSAASPSPSLPPAVGPTMPIGEARRLVAFEPLAPAELGPPDRVEVSADRRILSMSWAGPDGPVRVDQFDGQLDGAFAKTAPGVEFTTVAGAFALWFDEPHDVVVLAADGTPRRESARLAGHTLIWEQDGSTLRLEGDLTRERAVEIAASSRPLP